VRGLSTSPIPYSGRTFDIGFDFIDHNLAIRTSEGLAKYMPLYPRSVADFYREFMAELHSLGIQVKISTMPQEVPDPIPFEQDERHTAYDAEYAHRFWQVLLASDSVFKKFRARFTGKASPVHFFWGSFDLAVTRFSGRRAPEREGADAITREAYSHECSSTGFWAGGGGIEDAAFYSYTVPEPPGYSEYQVRPEKAHYHTGLREFILMYDDARREASPSNAILDFLQSTYEAGATLGRWDRAALERTV
jgi:hypothetical protein